MNNILLSRFADELRAALLHHYLDEPRWFTPVLSLPFDRDRNHLVVVLEAPGPFAFLRAESPFEGASAPQRLTVMKGAEVTGVNAEGRVLIIDARTRREQWDLTLRLSLFGANGSAQLLRGDAVMETIGRPARSAAPAHDIPSSAFRSGRFELVTRGREASAMPGPPGATADEADVRRLGVFNDARSACAHAGELILKDAHHQILSRISRPAVRKLKALEKLALNLQSDLDTAATHPDARREAEALAAYQSRVRPGTDSVDVPDLYDADRTLHLALDPKLPVHVQVEKRFRRAAKLEKAMAHLTKRLDLVQTELSQLGAAFDLLGKSTSFTEALKIYEVMRAKFGITLERSVAQAAPGKAAREKTYRSFELDPRWYVMVGRSNQENDEITFKVSSPGDWWFHAEGVPGSHVLLRSRGGSDAPPTRIIEQAASVAAHYSKARHSGLVPVIYTLRKYVRKFRGAEPGQVRCERETMVMVPPALPADVPDEP